MGGKSRNSPPPPEKIALLEGGAFLLSFLHVGTFLPGFLITIWRPQGGKSRRSPPSLTKSKKIFLLYGGGGWSFYFFISPRGRSFCSFFSSWGWLFCFFFLESGAFLLRFLHYKFAPPPPTPKIKSFFRYLRAFLLLYACGGLFATFFTMWGHFCNFFSI